MPHLANCHRLQTQIPLYTAHLKPAPSPLVRAGKIVIYANLRSSQITFSSPVGHKVTTLKWLIQ